MSCRVTRHVTVEVSFLDPNGPSVSSFLMRMPTGGVAAAADEGEEEEAEIDAETAAAGPRLRGREH